MIFLILSIISSSLIYVIFKLLDKISIKIFPVIIINYLTAALTGYLFREKDFSVQEIFTADWIYISIIIGILFIAMFYLIGISTQKAGITVTSISTKMSVVFPMLFSILYYGESLYLLKIGGIFLALLSIILSTIKDKNGVRGIKNIIFPAVLFLGMGLVDSLVKFNQEEFLQNTGVIESTTVIFAVSAIIGISIQFIFNFKANKVLKVSTLLFGILLGLSNFGSLYFLILALNAKFLDSSVVFAINNTAIILIAALVGRFFFKEKLILLNWIGVIVSMIAILALSI
ncbi:MAG: EamA/RhaT family transporter [Bacteroidota bacterium]